MGPDFPQSKVFCKRSGQHRFDLYLASVYIRNGSYRKWVEEQQPAPGDEFLIQTPAGDAVYHYRANPVKPAVNVVRVR